MADVDALPVHTTTAVTFPPADGLLLPRMRGQRAAAPPPVMTSFPSESFQQLREEVAYLTMLVRDQNRLLVEIAEHVGRRLDALERVVEARSRPTATAIERFDLASRAQARDGMPRRYGLGRGLAALIPGPAEPQPLA